MQPINYEAILTPEVKRHIKQSVEASKFEGSDSVFLDYDRITGDFFDKLTPEQYRAADIETAENVLFYQPP